jgi:hypothetical protein
MTYRTKTYIAADWEGDRDAVEQLNKWNKSKYWGLSFNDAHDLQQSRDESLNCSIKRSLVYRLNASKTFVLIVGNSTKTLRSGSCQYCSSKNRLIGSCSRGYNIDNRGYIEFECEKAVRDEKLKIIVLYNAARVDRSKCPDIINSYGIHKAMLYIENSQYYWNYEAVKSAFSQ